jgi:hypothetical protein
MNDVKDLLELALAGEHGPDLGREIDVAGDLTRGRRLLRRHRLTAIIGGSGVAAGVAAVALGVNTAGAAGPAGHGHRPGASVTLPAAGTSSSATHPARGGRARSVELVSYDGRQIPGFHVSRVLAGGNTFALFISPRGEQDTSVIVIVALRPGGEPAPAEGARVPVSGRLGFLRRQGSTETLTYRDSIGSWVDIHVPSSLGWHARQFAEFAAGIQIRSKA